MTPHLTEDDLLLHYYGDTDPSRESTVAGHLASCSECRASLVALERLLAIVSSGVDVDPPPSFEGDTWRRLAAHVAAGKGTQFLFRRDGTRKGNRVPFSWRVWGAAAAGVLLAAFLVAQLWLPASNVDPRTAKVEDTGSPPDERRHRGSTPADAFRERVLLADLGEHFDRSEMMLVELVNTADHTPADIRREQARAEDLLSANRLYRQTAADVGNARVAQVLEELERVLVDVAASSPAAPANDLDVVGRRAESQSLIFKVRVLSAEVEDRQRRPADARS